MDESLELTLQDQVLETRLRNLVINQVAIVERLQQQALSTESPKGIHNDIRTASEALVNLMDGSGDVFVMVGEGE